MNPFTFQILANAGRDERGALVLSIGAPDPVKYVGYVARSYEPLDASQAPRR
jgi:hypothetical protein